MKDLRDREYERQDRQEIDEATTDRQYERELRDEEEMISVRDLTDDIIQQEIGCTYPFLCSGCEIFGSCWIQ